MAAAPRVIPIIRSLAKLSMRRSKTRRQAPSNH
jgi:hypothetical protein